MGCVKTQSVEIYQENSNQLLNDQKVVENQQKIYPDQGNFWQGLQFYIGVNVDFSYPEFMIFDVGGKYQVCKVIIMKMQMDSFLQLIHQIKSSYFYVKEQLLNLNKIQSSNSQHVYKARQITSRQLSLDLRMRNFWILGIDSIFQICSAKTGQRVQEGILKLINLIKKYKYQKFHYTQLNKNNEKQQYDSQFKDINLNLYPYFQVIAFQIFSIFLLELISFSKISNLNSSFQISINQTVCFTHLSQSLYNYLTTLSISDQSLFFFIRVYLPTSFIYFIFLSLIFLIQQQLRQYSLITMKALILIFSKELSIKTFKILLMVKYSILHFLIYQHQHSSAFSQYILFYFQIGLAYFTKNYITFISFLFNIVCMILFLYLIEINLIHFIIAISIGINIKQYAN
ncbi:unnamed protein product (macronuclear) [Paramecium tetraurelia]|uniref:Transmembrane protein n=1 Tax=Paramecium tetraurelia TaxID=5888 RepID=A0CNL0_PARTE|nr:uncharacterized protein GSPATT00008819001 [Paramecium tetraurelia]CAK72377.1 unnamed protein product [Paramecium tetraurelia]|eukprot:XP_001439774.1 hypothetical protein (macronuclear) [Paramecium tetraurelia strain d4-2]